MHTLPSRRRQREWADGIELNLRLDHEDWVRVPVLFLTGLRYFRALKSQSRCVAIETFVSDYLAQPCLTPNRD